MNIQLIDIDLIKSNPNNPRPVYVSNKLCTFVFMEKYKDIIGFEGLYQAGSYGNIKSLLKRCNKSDKLLKSGTNGCGYKVVTLCKDKKHYTKTVHRLIAISFFGKSNLPVNHKDGIKSNNYIENLEFITASENQKHAIKNGLLIPNTKKIAEEKRKKVLQINPITNEIIKIYNSAHEASKITGFNRGNICSACRGNGKLVNKYNWKYAV